MPQVFTIVSPRAQDTLSKSDFINLARASIATVEEIFGIKGFEDVAFTAIPALWVEREADLQIEIRYTVGEDEYGWERPFEPSREQQKALADKLGKSLDSLLAGKVQSVSVWVKPIRDSIFVWVPDPNNKKDS